MVDIPWYTELQTMGFSTPTFRDHEAKATRDRLGKPVPRRLVVVAALRSETPALWDPLGIKCGHGQFLINGGGTGWYMEKKNEKNIYI